MAVLGGKGRPSEEMTFEQSSEGSEGASLVDIRQGHSKQPNSKSKGPETGTYTTGKLGAG